MPPRLNVLSFARPIAYRPRLQASWRPQPAVRIAPSQYRAFADSKQPPANETETNNLHVSEEAAKTAEIMGDTPPAVEEKGTPVEEVSPAISPTCRVSIDFLLGRQG